jgi:hypothetical protein
MKPMQNAALTLPIIGCAIEAASADARREAGLAVDNA